MKLDEWAEKHADEYLELKEKKMSRNARKAIKTGESSLVFDIDLGSHNEYDMGYSGGRVTLKQRKKKKQGGWLGYGAFNDLISTVGYSPAKIDRVSGINPQEVFVNRKVYLINTFFISGILIGLPNNINGISSSIYQCTLIHGYGE